VADRVAIVFRVMMRLAGLVLLATIALGDYLNLLIVFLNLNNIGGFGCFPEFWESC